MLVGLAGCQLFPEKTQTVKPKILMPVRKEVHTGPLHPNAVQEKLTKYLMANHINGSVAILKNDKTIFNEGFGYANLKTGTQNLPSTTYPLASVTKAIVATSIMQLQEKGLLNIYDPVAKFLPHFPNGKKIRLINLLNHTSGIQTPVYHSSDRTPADLVREIEKNPVKFQPGEKYDYRSENYIVLGYILEQVTHTPLHEYIQKNIFDRAGMRHSGFLSSTNPVPYSSRGYNQSGKQISPSGGLNVYTNFACGDIYSTAYDLALFDQALMSGKLVTQKTLKQMEIPGSSSDYALGVYNSSGVIHSLGVISGWEVNHAFFPDKTSIAILLNVRNKAINAQELTYKIYNIVKTET